MAEPVKAAGDAVKAGGNALLSVGKFFKNVATSKVTWIGGAVLTGLFMFANPVGAAAAISQVAAAPNLTTAFMNTITTVPKIAYAGFKPAMTVVASSLKTGAGGLADGANWLSTQSGSLAAAVPA